jgi:hypothetical protein
MTPGELVRAVSIALEVPAETVVQHDRNLAVAGLRTKGGRGRSAAQVTSLDAARLVVATVASFRTKDSVETVRLFEQAIFEPLDKPRYFLIGGFKVRDGGGLYDPETVDSAILKLPQDHNVIEAVAAIIDEASQPIADFEAFLNRFSALGVSCSSPFGQAKIGDATFASYSVPREIPESPSREPLEARKYYVGGIRQERAAPGVVMMLLGAAFRDDGLRYANAYEAYIGGYGTKAA